MLPQPVQDVVEISDDWWAGLTLAGFCRLLACRMETPPSGERLRAGNLWKQWMGESPRTSFRWRLSSMSAKDFDNKHWEWWRRYWRREKIYDSKHTGLPEVASHSGYGQGFFFCDMVIWQSRTGSETERAYTIFFQAEFYWILTRQPLSFLKPSVGNLGKNLDLFLIGIELRIRFTLNIIQFDI